MTKNETNICTAGMRKEEIDSKATQSVVGECLSISYPHPCVQIREVEAIKS